MRRHERPQPAAARASGILIGVLCGTAAALRLGGRLRRRQARHLRSAFRRPISPLHRFFWSGLLLMPLVLRDGIADLGGIGWGRGLVMSVLAGPPQAMIAYTGFILVPLGHGTTIQPACAALFGPDPRHAGAARAADRRSASLGGATIIAGLIVFGAESLATIGSHGVGGDLLFATAGLFWATFGIAAALLARVGHARDRGGRRAVGRGLRAAVRAVRRL